MEYTQIVNAGELEKYADTRESEAVIPELVYRLVNESCSDLTTCRIPYGDNVNQSGIDGLIETENGFHQFIPKGKNFWEIGTGKKPQEKAGGDFTKRTEQLSAEERQKASFVFVTPRAAGAGGWNEPDQRVWLEQRKDSGWSKIKILDGIQLADWIQEFPAVGKWLLKKMGLVKSTIDLTTPAEHWENIQQLTQTGDPPLPPKIFIIGRDQACAEMSKLFRGEIEQVVLASESEADVMDFIAAFLESLDAETQRHFCNKCLFIKDAEAWNSMASLRVPHVLVAHPKLDLEYSGEHLHMTAKKNGHAIVIAISGTLMTGSNTIIRLNSPSASVLEVTLTEAGFKQDRARELAGAGALKLSALKRYMRGLSELPPYATWESARALSQAGLLGRWKGDNLADKAIVENLIKTPYREWIQTVHSETLRSDTPVTQQNENWKIISRGEAWAALGPRLCDEDLSLFQNSVLTVLGEHDPKFELPKEERFAASIHGKVLKHSESLRTGMAETLALLGSRSKALSSCSQGKPELVATLTVRALLKDTDWVTWASLGSYLPMLAEAAPNEFLDAVANALLNPTKSPFNGLFAQEGSGGVLGWNYTSSLLWALETLAWHSDYLVRVTTLLGELAAIDPGGTWANRPSNSLIHIFLPWHPQTCANIQKRKEAIELLLREQPDIGWKLLIALLPQVHSTTSGCRKPAWRNFISPGWSEKATEAEYWDQVSGYAALAVRMAATDISKLAELIDHLPNLPSPAYAKVLEHLSTDMVLGLPQSDRLPLWEALADLTAKHRKFADAKWAMPIQSIEKIEEVAVKLSPKLASMIHRRLFSDRDFDLFEEKGSYEEQEQTLNLKRQDAIRDIIKEEQIAGVLDFVNKVASPWKVGCALGCIELDLNAALLPSNLEKEDSAFRSFIGGFVWARFWKESWSWVDDMLTKNWTIQNKGVFLTLLPFNHETWQRAEKHLDNNAEAYWKKVNVIPWRVKEHLVEAIEKLLYHKRPKSALRCLNSLIHDKIDLAPELAVRALKDNLNNVEDKGAHDRDDILEVIKWLQSNPKTNTDELFKIEWSYLPFLDNEFGGAPKTLEYRLVSDPSFFCEVIGIVYKSDKKQKEELTEKRRNIAKNAYRLLNAWKTVPGTPSKGSFDGKAFTQWVKEVKELVTISGHFDVAMSQIGQVLPYSIPDPDGLWIHHSVAKILDNKDADRMRSGFTMELFNMRSVFGFSAGKEERAIAARNREKAETLEHHGYNRFATAMRKFADQYDRDADREATRDPFED